MKLESLNFSNIGSSSLKEVYEYLQLELEEEAKKILEIEIFKFSSYAGFNEVSILIEPAKEKILKQVLEGTISLNEVEKEFSSLVLNILKAYFTEKSSSTKYEEPIWQREKYFNNINIELNNKNYIKKINKFK